MLDNNSFEVDKAKMRRTVVYPKSKSELSEFGDLVCSTIEKFNKMMGRFGGELSCINKGFNHCLCVELGESKSFCSLVRNDFQSELLQFFGVQDEHQTAQAKNNVKISS